MDNAAFVDALEAELLKTGDTFTTAHLRAASDRVLDAPEAITDNGELASALLTGAVMPTSPAPDLTALEDPRSSLVTDEDEGAPV